MTMRNLVLIVLAGVSLSACSSDDAAAAGDGGGAGAAGLALDAAFDELPADTDSGGAGGEPTGGDEPGRGGAGGEPGDASAESRADSRSITGQGPLPCPETLQCTLDCGGDDACAEACLGHGTREAQARVEALVTCLVQSQCGDGACLENKCRAERDACLAPPAPPVGSPTVHVPAGQAVPPEFVGAWNYSSVHGSADGFTFNANGTAARKQLHFWSFSGCTNAVAIEHEGSVAWSAGKDAFTFYVTKSTVTKSGCSQSTTEPGPSGVFDFTVEPSAATKMWIFDVQGCAATSEEDKRSQCGHEYTR
jgi:hypothetical protein